MNRGGMWSTLQTLLAAATGGGRRDYNPNPPGQFKPGSATNQTLDVLLHVWPRYLTRAQIAEMADCSPKSVDWALHYLRAHELVECRRNCDQRSPLYQEYRASRSGIKTTKDDDR